MNKQMSTDQLCEFARALIMDSVENNSDMVKRLLAANGVRISDDIPQGQLLMVTIKAMKDSTPFRVAMMNQFSRNINERMAAGGGEFSNADGKKAWEDTFVGSILTKDRIGNVLDTSLGLWANAANAKSQKESEERAIEYEKAQAEKYQAQSFTMPSVSGLGGILKPVLTIGILVAIGWGGWHLYKKSRKS